jgi:hypothetical protein
MAGTTGLEPATSAVTGQRSNQLNYVPRFTKPTAGWWAVTDLNRGPSRCKPVPASSYHNRSEPITAYQIFNFWPTFRKPVTRPYRLLEVLICYTFRYTDFRSNLPFVRGTLRGDIALSRCSPTMSSIPQTHYVYHSRMKQSALDSLRHPIFGGATR